MLRSATRHEDWVLLRDTSPDGWGPPSPTAVPSAPPLTRQPSIRRLPARSRTVDFTDFTSRRRSSGREGNSNVLPSPETETDDSTTPTTSSRLSPNTTWVPPRRFFPTRRPELPWSPTSENGSLGTGTGPGTGTGTGMGMGSAATSSARSSPAPSTATMTTQPETRSPRTFLSWIPSTALLSLPPPPPTDLRGSRPIPRLRRGGVRPPESLLGQHIAMLRTESPEPMAGGTAAATAGAADASAGPEGDVSSSLVDTPTLSPRNALAPVDAPRAAQSPTPAE